MKKIYIKSILFIVLFFFCMQNVFADSLDEAKKYLELAKTTQDKEESYSYIHKARVLYEDEYDIQPANIEVLLGLSKVNQLLEDRANAKLYVLKAYNTNPSDSRLQMEMGDFYYSFQEYSTAIEYYKLALASGLLRDYQANIQNAKCYEKLGDMENAELYYKISYHLNSTSIEAKEKIDKFEEARKPVNKKQAFYEAFSKALEQRRIDNMAEDLIEKINDPNYLY